MTWYVMDDRSSEYKSAGSVQQQIPVSKIERLLTVSFKDKIGKQIPINLALLNLFFSQYFRYTKFETKEVLAQLQLLGIATLTKRGYVFSFYGGKL